MLKDKLLAALSDWSLLTLGSTNRKERQVYNVDVSSTSSMNCARATSAKEGGFEINAVKRKSAISWPIRKWLDANESRSSTGNTRSNLRRKNAWSLSTFKQSQSPSQKSSLNGKNWSKSSTKWPKDKLIIKRTILFKNVNNSHFQLKKKKKKNPAPSNEPSALSDWKI